MATKLKNLKITKVDFVDQGANPDAHIRMVKRKDGEAQENNDTGEKTGGIWKRLFSAFAKSAGIDQQELEDAVEDIEKSGAMTFGEQMNERKTRKIADEMWDICFALENSLVSIMRDEELDSSAAQTAMMESLKEFNTVVQAAITEWSEGKTSNVVMKNDEVSESELEIMKSAARRLNEFIQKAEGNASDKRNQEKPKGDNEEMKIDKSKLTDAERAFLDSIEKRYGVEDEEQEPPVGVTKAGAKTDTKGKGSEEEDDPEDETGKGTAKKPPVKKSAPADGSGEEDIYKGLHPAVAAEMQALRKFREEAEEKELSQVAKKYAVIGKKEEELVPLLKNLKAAGGTAYADMIAILDQTVDTVEKSGVFSEIGKSGHGGSGENSAEAKISGIAKSYMEKDPALSYSAAVAKAWEDNPDILSEYDEEAGF